MTDDLMTITEAGRLLGISKQRADVISHTDPDFPDPAAEGVRGRRTWRLWRREDVMTYGKATGRATLPTFLVRAVSGVSTQSLPDAFGTKSWPAGRESWLPLAGRV